MKNLLRKMGHPESILDNIKIINYYSVSSKSTNINNSIKKSHHQHSQNFCAIANRIQSEITNVRF